MVRIKTPAKSSRDLYPSSLSTTSRSRFTSPSSSGEDIRREHNPLNTSHSKSSSNRKGIPRKSTTKCRTKLFVRKTTPVVDKSGKKSAKAKILREIRFLQSTVNHLIPKLPFSRVVREIMQNRRSDIYISSIALEALQEATEIYLT
ncbi:hypothetical protein WA026_008365 [Henosepilachna vigintioctopunctata]|uniref:Core Histone H2A/H2B/H3 domain-containing protein n=1 Tax=Henosepilachna vigintioctopunctata TaxID=420089 RepID=A0AAW1UGF7_9CUCU